MLLHAAAETEADACLEVVASGVTSEAWTQLQRQVEEMVADRTALFPSGSIELTRHEGLLGAAPPSLGIRIKAGHAEPDHSIAAGSCLEPGLEWTTRLGQGFLQAGADEMLAQAPTTPGVESSVDIEWVADEDRLRTTLVFAGPFDIPKGTCWIDDALSLDEATGVAVASGDQGVETSPFAEGACGRFFEHLPDGGAGEQAISMFPRCVPLKGGGEIRFVATYVSVTPEAVVVGGVLEAR